jgi:hypothetical protein
MVTLLGARVDRGKTQGVILSTVSSALQGFIHLRTPFWRLATIYEAMRV